MDLYPEANIQKIHKNSINLYNFIAKPTTLTVPAGISQDG